MNEREKVAKWLRSLFFEAFDAIEKPMAPWEDVPNAHREWLVRADELLSLLESEPVAWHRRWVSLVAHAAESALSNDSVHRAFGQRVLEWTSAVEKENPIVYGESAPQPEQARGVGPEMLEALREAIKYSADEMDISWTVDLCGLLTVLEAAPQSGEPDGDCRCEIDRNCRWHGIAQSPSPDRDREAMEKLRESVYGVLLVSDPENKHGVKWNYKGFLADDPADAILGGSDE